MIGSASESDGLLGAVVWSVVLSALLVAAPANAIDSTWKAGGPSTDWHEPLNWTNGVPQGVGDFARLTSSPPTVTGVQLNAPASLGHLIISGTGNFTLSGAGPLTFSAPGGRVGSQLSIQPSSGVNSSLSPLINVPVVLAASETLTVGLTNRASIRLHGVVSGEGGILFSGGPTGVGSEIRGNNTYSGLTTIDLGIDFHIDAVTATAFGDASRETILRSGRVSLWEGTAEEFVVERQGILIPTYSTTPYAGKMTLAGGALLPASRFINEQEQVVEIDSEIGIRGRGYIGLSPYGGSNSVLKGAITGGGLLIFQGSTSETITSKGSIQHRGDVLGSDRSNTILAGEFRPAGDLKVDGGISHSLIRVEGDASQFAGNVETRLGRLVVATDMHVNRLKVDARLASWRESLQQGGVTVEAGAALHVDSLQFYAGDITGRIEGVEQITKQTRIAGALSRLEGFDGIVAVEEGLLDVTDSGALGTTAGHTAVLRQRNAALALYQDVRVEDAVYLNNASGFDFQGALVGPGDMAGQLYLGDQGAYIGGYGGTDGTFERSGNLTVSGSIHGGTLYKNGTSNDLFIAGAGHTYTGDTNVLGGQFFLQQGGRLETTAAIRVGGGRINTSGQPTAALVLDNRGPGLQDRVADHIPVHLHSGRLELLGDAAQSSETIGKVSLDGGWNRINATGGVLRLNQLERNPGSIAAFLPSQSGRVEIASAALDDGILGGWALFHQNDYRPQGFATVSNGVVSHADSVVQSLNVSTSTQNVDVHSSNTLTKNVTVNSFKTSGTADIDLAGHRLTVDSGGILALGYTTISNGTLTAGSGGPSELFLHNYWTLDVDADVVDNGGPLGLHASGIGFVKLGGTNTYTGGTRISRSSGIHVLNRSAVPTGDVVDIDSGRYLIDFSDGQPLSIERLILRGSALVDGSSNTALDANHYEAYAGSIWQPITGDGLFVKRGEGEVELAEISPGYVGPMLVEQGLLEISGSIGGASPDESSAITVREGGVLSARDLPDSRLVVLEGGELRALFGSGVTPQFPIEVRGGGRISGLGAIHSPIRGAGDLTIDGPYNYGLSIHRGFNNLDGDVTITGGSVSIVGNSSEFAGVVHIRASGADVNNLNAFGPGGAIVHPEGMLAVQNAVAGPVELAGGLLRAATNNANVHRLNVVADSEIETGETYLYSLPTSINMQTSQSATFADGVRLKKTGPGQLTLNGVLTFGAGVEIVAWEGAVELRGAINARPGSSLNFRGNNNLKFTGSLYLPAGSSFELLNDGVPQQLSFTSTRFTGLGTVKNDVDVRHQGVISPGPGPGTLAIDGNLSIGAGALLEWDLANPAGTAGDAAGWDLLDVAGTLAFDGNPWQMNLYSFGLPAASSLPAASRSLGPGSQQWLIAAAADIVGFDPAKVMIDATHLAMKNPRFAQGEFYVRADGGNLYLVHAVPEPAALALASACMTAIGSIRRQTVKQARRMQS